MALTYQTSWDSMPGLYDPQSEVTDALFGFLSDPFEASTFNLNSLFNPEPEPNFYSEAESQLLTIVNPPLSCSFIPSLYQHRSNTNDNFTLNPPKRYRTYTDLLDANNLFGTNSFVTPTPTFSPYSTVGFGYQQTQNPNFFGMGREVRNWRPVPLPASNTSAAARERRKRISDKTQELCKMIPGGTRLNTAQMFEAASNYLKFMRAQIGILALMNSNKVGEFSVMEQEIMKTLLGSKILHDKLSVAGMCLVPEKLVENLAKDKAVRSSAFVARGLDRFVESIKSRD